jgi:hypothetical protein
MIKVGQRATGFSQPSFTWLHPLADPSEPFAGLQELLFW